MVLDRKQALFFEPVRIAEEMIDIGYSRLADCLLKSWTPEIGGVTAAAAFLDAWSVIDSAHRFIGLVGQCLASKQEAFARFPSS